MITTTSQSSPARQLLNKVPEVTIYFWVIKVFCTTVGESAADYLNVNRNLGLTGTSIIVGSLLAVMLAAQILAKQYRPARYWLTVAVVSVFGTLVTDNLTDKAHVPLEKSAILFSFLLAGTFGLWYRSERTLSIHRVFTRRREIFYWCAVLFSFALGTATGDLMAEALGFGYLATGTIVAGLIAATAIAWHFKLNPILSFWIIYILTRPLGASIGDYLAQPIEVGGRGLGTTTTSIIFLAGILGVVGYLSITKADVQPVADADAATALLDETEKGGLWQTVIVVAVFLVVGGFGYNARKTSLATTAAAETAAPSTPAAQPGVAGASTVAAPTKSPLGDLTKFTAITQDTLTKLTAGDQAGATNRIKDLELLWDTSAAKLKARNGAAWTDIDGQVDTVLRALRSTSPDVAAEKKALETLLSSLG